MPGKSRLMRGAFAKTSLAKAQAGVYNEKAMTKNIRFVSRHRKRAPG